MDVWGNGELRGEGEAHKGDKAGPGCPQQALTDEHTSDRTFPTYPTDFQGMEELTAWTYLFRTDI